MAVSVKCQNPSSTHIALCFVLLPTLDPVKSPTTFSPDANQTVVHLKADQVLTFQEDHGPLVWSDNSPNVVWGSVHTCNFGSGKLKCLNV